ncbi:nucleotide sugar transporter SLC35B4 isoform X2 [Larus michahellis]|uniref:nucleotide sugar transporter SLC35B4 isoform X2 n=1 Tax=Larus michahellis TaxID=119627 RepID=UPI003D9AD252
MHPAVAVGLVFGGCCSNVVFLELLARQFPGCGNIVTFSQFLFIAVEGFIFETNFGRKKPAIPIRYYFIMVAMFFTVSVVNNYALNLNIAMPLHMIFRSGSLIASMALGIIILKKRYSVYKYTSIALVSLGIFTCTFMSAKQVASDSSLNEDDGPQVFLWWLLGIAALTFALLMSARMGIFQEMLYKQFGKHSKEALFYNHALPLPGFLLLAPNIYHHAVLFSQTDTAPNLGSGCWRIRAATWLLLSSSTKPAAGYPGCLHTLWWSVEHLGLRNSKSSADLQEQLFLDLFCSPWKSSLSCASNF